MITVFYYEMSTLGSSSDSNLRFFLTRDQGERAYKLISDYLSSLPDAEILVLDFPGHQLMDASFADELLIQLMEHINRGEFGRRTIAVKGLTADTELNIRAVIELRRLQEKIAILMIDGQGLWNVLGHLEPNLQEAFTIAISKGKLTAPQLSKALKVTVNSANNRLKRLYDLRLLERNYDVSEKGLEYTYFPWH